MQQAPLGNLQVRQALLLAQIGWAAWFPILSNIGWRCIQPESWQMDKPSGDQVLLLYGPRHNGKVYTFANRAWGIGDDIQFNDNFRLAQAERRQQGHEPFGSGSHVGNNTQPAAG